MSRDAALNSATATARRISRRPPRPQPRAAICASRLGTLVQQPRGRRPIFLHSAQCFHRLSQLGQKIRGLRIFGWPHRRQPADHGAGVLSGLKHLVGAAACQRRCDVEGDEPASVDGSRRSQVDAAEAGLVGRKVRHGRSHPAAGPSRLAARKVKACADIRILQPGRDRITAARSAERTKHLSGRVAMAGGQVCLGGDERSCSGGQPHTIAFELRAQPHCRADQPRPRTPRREVRVQHDELSGASPSVIAPSTEPAPRACGELPGHDRIARRECTASSLQLGLTKILRQPIGAKHLEAARKEESASRISPASARTRARSSNQTPRETGASTSPASSISRNARRQVAGEELEIGEIVERLELTNHQTGAPGYRRRPLQIGPGRLQTAGEQGHGPSVEHDARLIAWLGVRDEFYGRIEGSQRFGQASPPHLDEPTLAMQEHRHPRIVCCNCVRFGDAQRFQSAGEPAQLRFVERNADPDAGGKCMFGRRVRRASR